MSAVSDKDLFRLDGKCAVVTGGAGIIGARVSRGLAEFGCNIAIVDIDLDAANAIAAEIRRDFGVEVEAIACDVASDTSVADMARSVLNRFGGVQVLFNNAATKSRDLKEFFAPFESYRLDVWREVMSVNLDGMFLVAQSLGRHMAEQGCGSIIQTASIYGVVAPDPGLYGGARYMDVEINTPACYAASKAAIVGLSRYLAAYWGGKGVRVNTLVPGGVESGQNDVFQASYAKRTPLGRMARRDEMVGAVVFLASEASSYVTGHILAVDGGWTAW